jgi:hypothetical protein
MKSKVEKTLLAGFLGLVFSGGAWAGTLPEFQITNFWMDQSCKHLYVTIKNKGAGVAAAYYDRTVPHAPFMELSSAKQQRAYMLWVADPQGRLRVSGGVITIELTDAVWMEAGSPVWLWINRGNAIPEEHPGSRPAFERDLSCSLFPPVAKRPLEVTRIAIEPDTNCSVKVRFRNPGPAYFSYDAWNPGPYRSLAGSLVFDGLPQIERSFLQVDPGKLVRPPGGQVDYVFDSRDYGHPFGPNQTKEVKVHFVWTLPTGNEVLLDVSRTLSCGVDLFAYSFHTKPAQPRKDQPFVLYASVQNIGTNTAWPSTATLKFGGESRPQEFQIPKLAPGAVYTFSRTLQISRAGDYLVHLKADAHQSYVELNEANNEKTGVVRVLE